MNYYYNQGVWSIWNTTASTQWVDPFWNIQHTSASSLVWNNWQTTSNVWGPGTTYIPTQVAPTVDPERARRMAGIRETRGRAHELRRRVAQRRAEDLLLSQLSPEQVDEYERLAQFHVITGGKTYRIRRGWAGNIERIEDGRAVERWCVHPRTNVPYADNLIAQKLMLETAPAELRAIANVTRLAA